MCSTNTEMNMRTLPISDCALSCVLSPVPSKENKEGPVLYLRRDGLFIVRQDVDRTSFLMGFSQYEFNQ